MVLIPIHRNNSSDRARARARNRNPNRNRLGAWKPVFDHEKLDIYRVSLDFAAWSYRLCKMLKGSDRHARDQILRASQSIPQNVAEGNGKRSGPDRRRFFEIARGSALECASILDILEIGRASCRGQV